MDNEYSDKFEDNNLNNQIITIENKLTKLVENLKLFRQYNNTIFYDELEKQYEKIRKNIKKLSSILDNEYLNNNISEMNIPISNDD